MNKAKRRIISGAIVFACVMTAIGAGAKLSRHADNGAVPAALTGEISETPVIILDAGHKERVLSIVILIHFICLFSELKQYKNRK